LSASAALSRPMSLSQEKETPRPRGRLLRASRHLKLGVTPRDLQNASESRCVPEPPYSKSKLTTFGPSVLIVAVSPEVA
jgi:hypothetical protein